MEYFLKQFEVALDTKQQDVVKNTQNHILVRGESASGKTHTMLARIAYLEKRENVSVLRMLNIFADQKSAETAAKQYRFLYLDESEMPVFTTIYAFAYRIIKRYNKERDIPVFKAYRNLDSVVNKLVLDMFNISLRKHELKRVTDKLSYAKSMMLTQKEIDAIEMDGIAFSALLKAYETYKQKKKIMDYDDLVINALNIMMNNEDIRSHYQQIYRYVHVDQAETLSFAGHLFLKTLIDQDNRMVMFANKQTYRSAAGAYPKSLDSFQEIYKDAQLYSFDTNYAASSTCVSGLNLFVYKDEEGPIQAASSEGEEIVCKAFMDLVRLYTYAKKQMLAVPDCTFVYRHPAYVLPLLDDLEALQGTCRMSGSIQEFFNDTMVKELLDYLQLIMDPKDKESFAAMYKSMNLDITEKVAKEVLLFLQEDESMDIFEALIRSSMKIVRKKDLTSQMEMIRILPNKETGVILKAIITRLHYDKRLAKLRVAATDSNLLVLKMMAQRYPDPQEFLHRMRELAAYEPAQEGTLQFLPIEQLQGKVYEHVYLLDCIEGSFPIASKDPLVEEDERSLFALCLAHSKHLELFGFRSAYDVRTQISPFVFEVHKKKEEEEAGAAAPVVRTASMIKKISEVHLKPRTKILHETLGRGVIKQVKDGMMQVHFENQEVKNLNVKHCLSNELIKLDD